MTNRSCHGTQDSIRNSFNSGVRRRFGKTITVLLLRVIPHHNIIVPPLSLCTIKVLLILIMLTPIQSCCQLLLERDRWTSEWFLTEEIESISTNGSVIWPSQRCNQFGCCYCRLPPSNFQNISWGAVEERPRSGFYWAGLSVSVKWFHNGLMAIR